MFLIERVELKKIIAVPTLKHKSLLKIFILQSFVLNNKFIL